MASYRIIMSAGIIMRKQEGGTLRLSSLLQISKVSFIVLPSTIRGVRARHSEDNCSVAAAKHLTREDTGWRDKLRILPLGIYGLTIYRCVLIVLTVLTVSPLKRRSLATEYLCCLVMVSRRKFIRPIEFSRKSRQYYAFDIMMYKRFQALKSSRSFLLPRMRFSVAKRSMKIK